MITFPRLKTLFWMLNLHKEKKMKVVLDLNIKILIVSSDLRVSREKNLIAGPGSLCFESHHTQSFLKDAKTIGKHNHSEYDVPSVRKS